MLPLLVFATLVGAVDDHHSASKQLAAVQQDGREPADEHAVLTTFPPAYEIIKKGGEGSSPQQHTAKAQEERAVEEGHAGAPSSRESSSRESSSHESSSRESSSQETNSGEQGEQGANRESGGGTAGDAASSEKINEQADHPSTPVEEEEYVKRPPGKQPASPRLGTISSSTSEEQAKKKIRPTTPSPNFVMPSFVRDWIDEPFAATRVLVNKLWPSGSPQETYRYYDFPLGCAPDLVLPQLMSLQQILRGDRLVNSRYDFAPLPAAKAEKKAEDGKRFVHETPKTFVCERYLSPEDLQVRGMRCRRGDPRASIIFDSSRRGRSILS